MNNPRTDVVVDPVPGFTEVAIVIGLALTLAAVGPEDARPSHLDILVDRGVANLKIAFTIGAMLVENAHHAQTGFTVAALRDWR